MMECMNLIYENLIDKFIQILENTKKACSISTFFFVSEVKFLIDMKAETEQSKENPKSKGLHTFSSNVLIQIYNKLNSNKNEFADEQGLALENYQLGSKIGILLPVKNFTVLFIKFDYITNIIDTCNHFI